MQRYTYLITLIGGLCASAAAHAGSAIFFHPDGMGANQWTAVRAVKVGPDGELNWDRLPHVAVYKGHTLDSITPSSHGGATIHAYGVKASKHAYGLMDTKQRSIAHKAVAAGKGLGLVNSGTITEPGTGAFVARVTERGNHDGIAEQILASGAQVILGGGEQWFLPKGVQGVHGKGVRKDTKNLVDTAKSQGFTVVYTADELMNIDIKKTPKLLGLFAAKHTFHDMPPDRLEEVGLPLFNPTAPTIGQMVQQALAVLQAHHADDFLLVAEEEGTDNFGNVAHFHGALEAGKRADDAIGVIREFIAKHPDTTMVMASDSDAGGLQVTDCTGSGVLRSVIGGCDNYVVSKPDSQGKTYKLNLLSTGREDVAGGVVIRAQGKQAGKVHGTMDNTAIYQILDASLFGTE